MIEFGQGSTIGFYIEGDTVVDFDANDFAIEYYKKNFDEKFKILKSEMTFISTNKYYGEIPYSVTENMAAGIYMQEIRLGSSYRSVSKTESFTIIETQIR
jgi:hypothetical protein